VKNVLKQKQKTKNLRGEKKSEAKKQRQENISEPNEKPKI